MLNQRAQPPTVPTPDWEGVISMATVELIMEFINRPGERYLYCNAVRTGVIRTFRRALKPRTPKDKGGLHGLLRIVIASHVPDWHTAGRAETVMAVAQRALDDDFRDRLRGFAGFVARDVWQRSPPSHQGMQHRSAMLDRVMLHAREAVAGSGSSLLEHLGDPGWLRAGNLRTILVAFDLTDPRVVGSLLKLVEDAARAELTKAIPGE